MTIGKLINDLNNLLDAGYSEDIEVLIKIDNTTSDIDRIDPEVRRNVYTNKNEITILSI